MFRADASSLMEKTITLSFGAGIVAAIISTNLSNINDEKSSSLKF
jgi:hypothetical protein